MEGNTLTFDETRSVMMRQLQINGKPWKDVMEMRGHDEVVRKIQQIGKGDVKITETRIKEIHKEIVFEEESSTHFKEIGKLKQRDNYLYNYRGERMDFITADETQRALNDLSNWLNNELSAFKKGKNTKSILEIAAEHHIRFLYIHPFFDGNGRTGRILMNLILIAQGYPPIIIRTDEKERYNKLITHAQAYEKNPIPFYEMMGILLIRSLELTIKAAKGENIRQPEEWIHKLSALENKLATKEAIGRTNESIYQRYQDSLLPLLEDVELKLASFNKVFVSHSIRKWMQPLESMPTTPEDFDLKVFSLYSANRLAEIKEIAFRFHWEGINNHPNHTFSLTFQLTIHLNDTEYCINSTPEINIKTVNDYSNSLTKDQKNQIFNTIAGYIVTQIEKAIGLF